MSKNQGTFFLCTNCSYQSIKWLGVCPQCQTWAGLEEQSIQAFNENNKHKTNKIIKTKTFNQIEDQDRKRIMSGIDEWDRVMGGGIMPASFIILAGDPGIGKSTLLLQIASRLSESTKTLYFSTEESLSQIKQRADRLNLINSNIFLCDERSFENISSTIEQEAPEIVIIDSIQSCFLSDGQNFSQGSLSQLKEISFRLMQQAKNQNVAILVTGHIIKDGSMAGPKLLEHMVDAVFFLNGEQTFGTRVLTATKNRFGPVGEVGFFQMNHNGLEPVEDINGRLLNEATQAPGSALSILCQGTRPVIVEFQALCVRSKFGQPQRVVTGADNKRVILVAAVLEKYLKMSFSSHDLFFKAGAGICAKESNTDLAIALALMSSYLETPVSKNTISIGEINLTGQIKTSKRDISVAWQMRKTGIERIISGKLDQPMEKQIQITNVFELLTLFPKKASKRIDSEDPF